jgi:hypothetical protein
MSVSGKGHKLFEIAQGFKNDEGRNSARKVYIISRFIQRWQENEESGAR